MSTISMLNPVPVWRGELACLGLREHDGIRGQEFEEAQQRKRVAVDIVLYRELKDEVTVSRKAISFTSVFGVKHYL